MLTLVADDPGIRAFVFTFWPLVRGGERLAVGVSGRRLLDAGKGCVALRDSPRETLANLSITGHLRGFSDQPGSKISLDHAGLLEGAGISSTR